MDIHSKLLDVFQTLEFETDGISDGTSLREELDIDSTEFAEIAVAIEREFLVTVNDNELQMAKTFGDLVQYVASAPRAE